MKLSVTSGDLTLSLQMDDSGEGLNTFIKLSLSLMSKDFSDPPVETLRSPSVLISEVFKRSDLPPSPTEESPKADTPAQQVPQTPAPQNNEERNHASSPPPYKSSKQGRQYSGFLFIKCSHCGEYRGFYTKSRLTSYHCNKCGSETPLEDLIPLRAKCECGKEWNYLTNMTEKAFDINCIECGSPISVFYNSRKDNYSS